MKKNILFVFLFSVLSISALIAQSEEDQIKQVIQKAYIEGIHNLGDPAEIDKGFHPCFVLLSMADNGTTVNLLPIYTWKETTRLAKEKSPNGPAVKTTCDYLMIDITGSAAMAKIQLRREGKLIFTDYLHLYKFKDGWKIVGKVFHRH
jgi:hypothetical protein